MSKSPQHFYEFDGIRLYHEQLHLIRLQDKAKYFIRPKARDFLVVLLRKPHETVTYEELRQQVWPEIKRVEAALQTIRETKRAIRKLLGDIRKKPDEIIQTVVKQGYRLNAHVIEGQDEDDSLVESSTLIAVENVVAEEPSHVNIDPVLANNEQLTVDDFVGEQPSHSQEPAPGQQEKEPDSLPHDEIPSPRSSPASPKAAGKVTLRFGGQLWHMVTSCTFYALLYAVALLLEVAYQFDRFGATVLELAPLVFLWILGTSIAGLAADWKWTLQGKTKGLVFSLCMFIGSSLLLYAALSLFLPGFPITDSRLQSHTAHGAYLKNVCYFLPLAVIFLLLPFHFVASLHREMQSSKHRLVHNLLLGKRRSVAPGNAIYLKVWWLTVLLSGAAIISLVLTFYLLDNLKPGPYMNLFTQLTIWRVLLHSRVGVSALVLPVTECD